MSSSSIKNLCFDLSKYIFNSRREEIVCISDGRAAFACTNQVVNDFFRSIERKNPFFNSASPIINLSFQIIENVYKEFPDDNGKEKTLRRYVGEYQKQFFSGEYQDLSREFSDLSKFIGDSEKYREIIIKECKENKSSSLQHFLSARLVLSKKNTKKHLESRDCLGFIYFFFEYIQSFLIDKGLRNLEKMKEMISFLKELDKLLAALVPDLFKHKYDDCLIEKIRYLERELVLLYPVYFFTEDSKFKECPFFEKEDVRFFYLIKSIIPFLLNGISEFLMSDNPSNDRGVVSWKGISYLKDIFYSYDLISFYSNRIKKIAANCDSKLINRVDSFRESIMNFKDSQGLKVALNPFENILSGNFVFYSFPGLFACTDALFVDWEKAIKPIIENLKAIHESFCEKGTGLFEAKKTSKDDEKTIEEIKEGIRISANLYDMFIVISDIKNLFRLSFRDQSKNKTDLFNIYAANDTIVQKWDIHFAKSQDKQLVGVNLRKKMKYAIISYDDYDDFYSKVFTHIFEIIKNLENRSILYEDMFYARITEFVLDATQSNFFCRYLPIFKKNQIVDWEKNAKDAEGKEDGNYLFALQFLAFMLNSVFLDQKPFEFQDEEPKTCADFAGSFIEKQWPLTRKLLEGIHFPLPKKKIVKGSEVVSIESLQNALSENVGEEEERNKFLWDNYKLTQTIPSEEVNLESYLPTNKLTPFSNGKKPKDVNLTNEDDLKEFILKYAEDYTSLIKAISSSETNHNLCKPGNLIEFLSNFCSVRGGSHLIFSFGKNTTTLANHRRNLKKPLVVKTLNQIFLGRYENKVFSVEEIRTCLTSLIG